MYDCGNIHRTSVNYKLLYVSLFRSSTFRLPCRGPGVIERVSIPDFEALTSHGNLSVVIRNTGDITTDYTVSSSIGV